RDTETDVTDMNRRLGGDASLNAPFGEAGDFGERQDWLVDDRANQETTLAASEEFDSRCRALVSALSVLNDRERRIFQAQRLSDDPITLQELTKEVGGSPERARPNTAPAL